MKNLNRRDFLRLAAGGSVAAGLSLTGCEGGFAGGGTAAKKPPNIIFLLTDDQRADTMGCTGNPIIKTPNMDAMAKDGVRFTNAFVT
ncbi:MAG: sulfatase, partial [Planctomycetaceae bacterium]